MFKKAWELLARRKRAITPSLAGVLLSAAILAISPTFGALGFALGIVIALIVLDIGRSRTLTILGGKGDWKGVWRRICVDSGFLALASLLVLILPISEAVAVMQGDYVTASVIGILWYYLLAVYILFLVEFFPMGYLVAVKGKSVEGALIESAKMFRRGKWRQMKRAIIYWAFIVVWVLINWIVTLLNGTAATMVSIVALLFAGAFLIPYMEAVYVVLNEGP
ncbi:MAG: hypothetical protein PWP76_591 [Candidatus Diapherotrites archaeon]|nr:hypothetical protein [Candidatus Diapherotrites archaeon]MDN5366842.1 hypothetical protein [Candidatus Diapherotrites archaeon]